VAQANGAASLCVGVEIDQLTGQQYLPYWTDIINSVRAVFKGQLTYAADWNDAVSPWQGQHGLAAGTGNLATQVSFWNQLDYVGIDCYAPLSDKANPTLADLIAGWTQVPTDPESKSVTGNQSLISYFASVQAQIGKPLLFTELGYESATDAASQPAGTATNVFDPSLQALCYQAFFNAWQQSGSSALSGVYFWDWDPNAAEVGPGNGANFSPQGLPAQDAVVAGFAQSPAKAAVYDFNGDGKSDFLWQNDDGQAAIWLLNGVSVATAAITGPNPGPAWHVVASGDFNDDGHSDILWQNDDGQAAVWTINGTAPVVEATVGPNPGPGWHVIRSGDFDGDGHSDILWQNSDGQAAIWLMNGTNLVTATVAGPNPGPGWRVVGAGDFNGDGHSDILWQNSDGQAAIWLMNGANPTSEATVGPNPGPNWYVIAAGDFNGDGKADILWQNGDGQAAIWLMNGTSVAASALVGPNPGDSWYALGAADVNGDGKADIVFQNADGSAAVWLMNGLNPTTEALVGPAPGSSWHMFAG
jgi:hypothetical protein